MVGEPGFQQIFHKGEPLRGMEAKTFVLVVMQKRHPDRLDMRYKCNRDFTRQLKQWREQHKPQPPKNQISLFPLQA